MAEAELRLKFRTGGLEAAAFPPSEVLAGWIDAALDRETPFKCTAGLHRAVRHTGEDGFEHHGFLNVLVATGAGLRRRGLPEVTQSCWSRATPGLLAQACRPYERGAGARRWFTLASAPARSPSRWADLRTWGWSR